MGSIFLATLIAVLLWAWWLSYGTANVLPRPHIVMWDILQMSQQPDLYEYGSDSYLFKRNPLNAAGLWVFEHFGKNYIALVLTQLPLLVLLIFSVSFIAWRIGGAFAGGVAPWIVLFAPMTIGCALYLDDHLILATMMAMAIAAVCWSSSPRLRLLALFPPLFMFVAIRSANWFSHSLLFLFIFGSAFGGFCFYVWGGWRKNRRAQKFDAKFYAPWIPTLSGLAALGVGLYLVLPIPVDYLIGESRHPDFASQAVSANWQAIFSWPVIWFFILAGPPLALTCIAALSVEWKHRRFLRTLPALIWLIAPMILLTIISKRQDFYLVSAVPATYVITAVGLAGIRSQKLKIILSALSIFSCLIFWIVSVNTTLSLRELSWFDHVFEGAPYPYLVSPKNVSPQIGSHYTFGVNANEKCSKRGEHVLFLSDESVHTWMAFYIWLAGNDTKIGDVREGPIFGDRPCIVAKYAVAKLLPKSIKQRAKLVTLDKAIERFRETAGTMYTPNTQIDERLAFVEAMKDQYEYVYGGQNWSLFAWKGDAPKKKETQNPYY